MKNLANQLYLISRLFPFLWPTDWRIRLRFILGIVLLFVIIALNIGVPLVFRSVINVISNQSSTLLLVESVLIFYGVLWLLSKTTEQLRLILMARVIERGICKLCLNVFDHLVSLSLRFHSSRKIGSIVNAIERAQSAFPNLIWGLFFVIVPTLIEIIIAACILTYLYGIIFGITLTLILTIYMIFSVVGSAWNTAALQNSNELNAQANNKIIDSLLNYETIRYFGNQEYEHNRCQNLLIARENAITKQLSRGEIMHIGQGIIMGVGLIILTWLSGIKVFQGDLHVSDFVLINGYLLQFMMPLGQFGYVFRSISEGVTNFKDILNLLDEKSEIIEKPDAKPLIVHQGNIIFENVKFCYDERRPILRGINFKIPAKKTIAIVGATGAGKSTISKLLFRFYDVTNGSILIDDQDIRDVTLSSLHQAIGIVPQHTALFHDTLHHNISYSRPDASENEIKKAISLAHLDAFIASLPEGLATMVGEQGLKLSGGERQRVAIARVLLKNPKILIFDEATSSLDTKTEQLIQQNIMEVSKNTTSIIIAHRLSTIIHADHIIVLDQGTIVEQGSHEELLKQGGIYAGLWSKQRKI